MQYIFTFKTFMSKLQKSSWMAVARTELAIPPICISYAF